MTVAALENYFCNVAYDMGQSESAITTDATVDEVGRNSFRERCICSEECLFDSKRAAIMTGGSACSAGCCYGAFKTTGLVSLGLIFGGFVFPTIAMLACMRANVPGVKETMGC